MRRAFMKAICAAGVALAGCAQPAARVADHAHDSSAVAALVHERLRAAAAGDTARWHQLVSDSCVWTGPALRVATTREVLPSIVANRALPPIRQEVRDLVVHVSGDVAQATYVQYAMAPDSAPESGKRFRKTDVLQRQGGQWRVIGAAEVAVPFQHRVTLDAAQADRLAGRYVLPGIDTLVVAPVAHGAFTMRGRDGSVDTLWAASDSSLFVEGDPGTWLLPHGARGSRAPAAVLVYRMAGAADVVLPRVSSP